ncbi:hypothetical protein CYMTET_12967 [Cymbomonas tetramitiformis]|uniref:Uncharacterized protein n=1 Tax=Cymbomonas tetramitiformis TaxID=36881 RepID=A0AAE0GJM1_9CHLO|nr:hypothetical protein CYMTET_12967 [Cymbomonas tetramitiformis]
MPHSKRRKFYMDRCERMNAARQQQTAADGDSAAPLTQEATPTLIDGRPALSSPVRQINSDLDAAAAEDANIPEAAAATANNPETTKVSYHAVTSPHIAVKVSQVEKHSDPNHLQKLLYKALDELRKEKRWAGGTLSKSVIEYFNKLYRHVIKSVAVIEDLPGFETDDEKAEWIQGALLNIVGHAFNIDPTHAACRRYCAPRPDGSSFHPWLQTTVGCEKSSRNAASAQVQGTYGGDSDLANDKYGNAL